MQIEQKISKAGEGKKKMATKKNKEEKNGGTNKFFGLSGPGAHIMARLTEAYNSFFYSELRQGGEARTKHMKCKQRSGWTEVKWILVVKVEVFFSASCQNEIRSYVWRCSGWQRMFWVGRFLFKDGILVEFSKKIWNASIWKLVWSRICVFICFAVSYIGSLTFTFYLHSIFKYNKKKL